VLEISYGLKGASPGRLVVPQLSKDIPVQQTLWHLWVPEEEYVLGYDRAFSRIKPHQCQRLLEVLGSRQPSPVTFKLPAQGKVLDFVRQGAPGKLSVTLVGKEGFSILVWVLLIVAGVLMLKLSGFSRAQVILGAALVLGMIHLYWPLLVVQALKVGVFAVVLVVLLWLVQWGFVRVPKIRQALPARQKKSPSLPKEPPAPKQKQKPSKEGEE
jgi:hypothetical protein